MDMLNLVPVKAASNSHLGIEITFSGRTLAFAPTKAT